MKITVSRDAVLKPLQSVIGVVENRQSMPILAHVLLKTQNNHLSILASDTEVECLGYSQLESENPLQQTTLPGKKLYEICKALPEDAILEFIQDNQQMRLKSGQSAFILSTLPAENFPIFEHKENPISLDLKQKILKKLLNKTYFAMANKDVRYCLNGVLLEISPTEIQTVATDGHRLAKCTYFCSTGISQKVQKIIPRKGVLELLRLLNNDDEEIKFLLGDAFISVQSKDFIFTTKLVEGRYPDYTRAMPLGGEKRTVMVEREIFKTALVRAAILSNEQFRAVRLILQPGRLQIISSNPEHEKANEEIAILNTQDQFETGFNVLYLLDGVNAIEMEQVELVFLESNHSVFIKENTDSFESCFVVMPMRF